MARNYTDMSGAKNPNYKTGLWGTPIYRVWRNMKSRCLNPNHPKYHRYGGRGVRVCQEWVDDVLAFRDFAVRCGYKDGMSIDRVNNDGDYCPENCRFVSVSENSRKIVKIVEKSGIIRFRALSLGIVNPPKHCCFRDCYTDMSIRSCKAADTFC